MASNNLATDVWLTYKLNDLDYKDWFVIGHYGIVVPWANTGTPNPSVSTVWVQYIIGNSVRVGGKHSLKKANMFNKK